MAASRVVPAHDGLTGLSPEPAGCSKPRWRRQPDPWAAGQLGISQRTLMYKMEKHGLKPPPSARKER